MTILNDTFNRANENPLAGNWTDASDALTDCELINTREISQVTGFGEWHGHRNDFTPGADQFSQFRIIDLGGTPFSLGPTVRMGTDRTGYGLDTSTAGPFIVRWGPVSGTPNIIHTVVGAPNAAVGDFIRIEVQGSVIRYILNGVVYGVASDGEYVGGRVGINLNHLDNIVDDWSGGDLPYPVGQTRRRRSVVAGF